MFNGSRAVDTAAVKARVRELGLTNKDFGARLGRHGGRVSHYYHAPCRVTGPTAYGLALALETDLAAVLLPEAATD